MTKRHEEERVLKLTRYEKHIVKQVVQVLDMDFRALGTLDKVLRGVGSSIAATSDFFFSVLANRPPS